MKQVVLLEESIHFVHVPEECKEAVSLFKNLMGSQVLKLEDVPKKLDEVVELNNSSHGEESADVKTISMVVSIDIPDGWSDLLSREMIKIYAGLGR